MKLVSELDAFVSMLILVAFKGVLYIALTVSAPRLLTIFVQALQKFSIVLCHINKKR